MPPPPYRNSTDKASRFSEERKTVQTLPNNPGQPPLSARRLSIVIPVFRESETINTAIDRLEANPFPHGLEIIVVDGEPEKTTLAAINHPGMIKTSSLPGRGVQMNRGAEKACGEILLFLHADTRLPENGLTLLHEAMIPKEIECGSFRLGIESSTPSIRLIERVANIRTRIFQMPYGDQGIFIRRKLFVSMGGFRPYPIMEDVDLMLRIRKHRCRFVLLGKNVFTSARRWEKEGAIRCTLRNWMIMALFLAGVRPERLARFYKTWRM